MVYLGFQKRGQKFLLATSAHTKGRPNYDFQFFSYGEKQIFAQRGPWSNDPPKYATVGILSWKLEGVNCVCRSCFNTLS